MDGSVVLVYGVLPALAVGAHLWWRGRRERTHAAALADAQAAGLAEPASLHPVIDPARCIGSGSCAAACPEQALGLVGGKATLVNASACIGHGACHAACPFDAISLVFGAARRGVDIPLLSPQFETNVPGLFIAGELGGMGLIRKAAEQGRQAMEAMAARARTAGTPDEGMLDALIVGAGPAGLSAALSAQALGLRYRVIEQEPSLGGAIFHYPRQKVAMTAPVQLALVGRVRFTEVSKETLLAFWQDVVQRFGLAVGYGERMDGIAPAPEGGFRVRTSRGEHRARQVLLAIGRRGTPRTLGVPGEDAAHVVYRLIDAAQYAGQAVLVVGGGDSALEAAIALAETAGTRVALSYRGEAFSRVKGRNRERLQALAAAGRVQLWLGSQVQGIEPHVVALTDAQGRAQHVAADAVIICAGGQLRTPLLQAMGIRFETKHGRA
ncbi:NAD(P)-binding domain-containing protein [Ideonella sp.]|uniref:NAD(P)-binding domain-containing protein n=1 Tax=Ideonella sp. TaxID=1929293 RepID=UPI0035B3862C